MTKSDSSVDIPYDVNTSNNDSDNDEEFPICLQHFSDDKNIENGFGAFNSALGHKKHAHEQKKNKIYVFLFFGWLKFLCVVLLLINSTFLCALI